MHFFNESDVIHQYFMFHHTAPFSRETYIINCQLQKYIRI